MRAPCRTRRRRRRRRPRTSSHLRGGRGRSGESGSGGRMGLATGSVRERLRLGECNYDRLQHWVLLIKPPRGPRTQHAASCRSNVRPRYYLPDWPAICPATRLLPDTPLLLLIARVAVAGALVLQTRPPPYGRRTSATRRLTVPAEGGWRFFSPTTTPFSPAGANLAVLPSVGPTRLRPEKSRNES